MTSKFNELLGEKLLEHNESDEKTNEVSINVLDGKYLGLYFSFVHFLINLKKSKSSLFHVELTGVHLAEISHPNYLKYSKK